MSDKTEAVQRMQELIARRYAEPITPADLAQAAHFSPWYAARLFRELTGLTPAEYIRRLRLSRSALLLRDSGAKIIDVAFDMGFASVDGYQRAFRREVGKNPKEYADAPVPLPLFTPYGVKFRELYQKEENSMDKVQNVFVQVMEKPARKVIVKRGVKAEEYWAYCQEVGCDVWGVLTSMKSLCGEPVCLWLPQRLRKPGTSTYVQGVEVSADFDGAIPEGFDVIDLPAEAYLMFQGEPFAEEDYCDAIRAVEHAMERYDPSFLHMAWDDTQPRIQLEPRGERGYIELRAVKRV